MGANCSRFYIFPTWHRSREEPVDNDSLIAALLADSDRYLGDTPSVPQPGAIVVSGDLIQGVGIGADKWADSMRELDL